MALAAIWGASFAFMRVAAPEFGAIPLIGVRLGIASLFLLPFYLAKYPAKELIDNKSTILIVAILGSALPFCLFAYATLYLSAGLTAILNAAVTIFTALVAYIWLKEKLVSKQIVGLIFGFIGVCLLTYTADALDQRATLLAVIAGIIASLSYALNNCYIKLYCTELSPLRLTTASLLTGFLLLTPFMIYLWPDQTPSIKSWLSVITLGVVCTGISFIMFVRLIMSLGPSRSALVALLIPVFAVIWGILWLDESMTFGMLMSGALVLLGTALASNLLGK